MSFTQNTFAPIGGQNTDTPAFWSYKTDDVISDVMQADYFYPKRFQLEIDDLIWIKASDAEALIAYKGDGEPSYVVAPKAEEVVLFSSSLSIQEPVSTDTPVQVEFGGPLAGDGVDLDAAGTITFNKDGLYRLGGIFDIGRQGGSGGVGVIFLRLLIDGVQAGNSIATLVNNTNTIIPEQFEFTTPITAGQVVEVEMSRDSLGVNEGGLFPLVSSIGWNPSPSASVRIARLL